VALVYDGGMTNSTLVIYDTLTRNVTPLAGFDTVSKQREAAW
jgi:hypothetical protein